jgi:RimJ/RimL family protein N-acetyltransferase
MRSIKTETLTLEPQSVAHAEEMFTLLGDPAIYEHEDGPPLSLEWLTERFAKLESRRSADGREVWLNWVVRLPSDLLAGFVQATVKPNDQATIAYVLHSDHWGRGLGQKAVAAMLEELVDRYHVCHVFAVLKSNNTRSFHLLERLGFVTASDALHESHNVVSDEVLMVRPFRA